MDAAARGWIRESSCGDERPGDRVVHRHSYHNIDSTKSFDVRSPPESMSETPHSAFGSAAAVAIDAGELPLGGGLLALVRPALRLLEPGGVLAINTRDDNLTDDLDSWCRLQYHEYLGREPNPDGTERHLIRRGSLGLPKGDREV